MTRISAALVIPLSLPLLVPAGPASAWSNGTDGPNSYGTHDWVLDLALDALGHRADWVCVLSQSALGAGDSGP